MFCRKCGKQISDQAAYCTYCGVQITSNQAKAKQPTIGLHRQPTAMKRVSRQRWGIWIAASIFVIVALLLILIGNQSKEVLTVQEAQAQMDAALEDVFREASSDNYLVQSLKGKVRISVDAVKNTEKGCLAKCTVTSVDVATPVLNYLLDLDEGINDTYSNVVADLQKAITEAYEIQQTFSVEFIQVNGKYKAMLPEEMVVFCSGNIQELIPKLYEILQGGTIE